LQIGNGGFQIAEMHFTISNELRNLKSRKSPEPQYEIRNHPQSENLQSTI